MKAKKYTRTKFEGVFGYETGKGRRFARKVSGVRKPDGTKGDSWKGGFMTAREAREDRRSVVEAIRKGSYVRPTKTTLGDYLTERWLPSQKGPPQEVGLHLLRHDHHQEAPWVAAEYSGGRDRG